MKRLFKIGSGLFIYSIFPIISWFGLSIILKDGKIANVFSITYAMQFIWAILKNLFASGANIRAEKENDQNAVQNGIFWGIIFSVLIFLIPIVFVDNYINFFGQNVSLYKPFVIFSIFQLLLQTILTIIIEKFYYRKNESSASLLMLVFNLISFWLLMLSCLLIKQIWIAIFIPITILSLFVVVLYFKTFEKFKIDFTFFKNFKYQSANITSNIFMLIIYLFGYQIVFSAGEQYLIALNICSLCTDAHWDSLNAISTATEVDVSKNELNFKKMLKNSYLYTFIVILLSFALTVAATIILKANFKIVLAYFAFQFFDMLLTPYILIFSPIIQIEYSPTLNTILELVFMGIRTILAFIIISPFCTDIAQISKSVLILISFLIIRFSKFKIHGDKLELKSKIQSYEK